MARVQNLGSVSLSLNKPPSHCLTHKVSPYSANKITWFRNSATVEKLAQFKHAVQQWASIIYSALWLTVKAVPHKLSYLLVTIQLGLHESETLTVDELRLQTTSTAACLISASTSFIKSSNNLNNLYTKDHKLTASLLLLSNSSVIKHCFHFWFIHHVCLERNLPWLRKQMIIRKWGVS